MCSSDSCAAVVAKLRLLWMDDTGYFCFFVWVSGTCLWCSYCCFCFCFLWLHFIELIESIAWCHCQFWDIFIHFVFSCCFHLIAFPFPPSMASNKYISCFLPCFIFYLYLFFYFLSFIFSASGRIFFSDWITLNSNSFIVFLICFLCFSL